MKRMDLCRRMVCSILFLGLIPQAGWAELLDAGAFRDLFEQYRRNPGSAAAGASLATADLTLVVFPGILAEFFTKASFSDVRQNMQGVSSLEVEAWRQYCTRADQARLLVNDLRATTIKDAGMGTVSRPLCDFIDLFAMPASGKRVHVIVLKSPPFSLETFGDLTVTGQRYEERLNTLFSELGWVPRTLSFVGYSLGGTVGYEVLEQISIHQRPWKGRIKAFVALAGIIHGNRLADIALGRLPGAPGLYAELINALWDLHNGLERVGQERGRNDFEKRLILLGHPGAVLRNSALWMRTIQRLTETLWNYRELNSGLNDQLLAILQTVDLGKLGEAGHLGLDALTSETRWLADYDQNIKRWQLFLANARRVVEQISTTEREEWFRSHPLEMDGMVIHEVHADMPEDPAQAESYSFDTEMVDYQLIRDNLRVHKIMTGFDSMDGWVGLEESCNDPARYPARSPLRPEARQPFSCWGVFPTDHWGLGVPNAVPQTTGSKPVVHPFPRQALLQAVSHALMIELGE